MKAALKSGDAAKLSVLRMLVAAIKTLEIDKRLKEISDQEVIQIVKRQINQHRESIDQFRKGNRPELAAKEELELKILEAYMPEQMGEAEVEAVVKAAISETGSSLRSDMGKVMKAVMEKTKGRCDGKLVNQIVMKHLK